jgi:hypothetical protein
MSMLIDAEIVNVLVLAAAPVVTVRREVPQAVWAQC